MRFLQPANLKGSNLKGDPNSLGASVECTESGVTTSMSSLHHMRNRGYPQSFIPNNSSSGASAPFRDCRKKLTKQCPTGSSQTNYGLVQFGREPKEPKFLQTPCGCKGSGLDYVVDSAVCGFCAGIIISHPRPKCGVLLLLGCRSLHSPTISFTQPLTHSFAISCGCCCCCSPVLQNSAQ